MTCASAITIFESADAAARLAAAEQFLAAAGSAAPALIVAAHGMAAADLARSVEARGGARFGLYRMSFEHLAATLAAARMAAAGLAPARGLALEAVAARAVFALRESSALAHFAPIADRPGFPGALARTLAELRMAAVAPAALAPLAPDGPALAALLERFELELRAARLADRTEIFAAACAALADAPAPALAGLPLVMLDLRIDSAREAELAAALAGRAGRALATVPAGDDRTLELLRTALGKAGAPAVPRSSATDLSGAEPRHDAEAIAADEDDSLARLKRYLFGAAAPAERALDASVTLVSAAGEMQECVEIARLIVAEAAAGVPFDRIAVAARDGYRYAPFLEEAFARAELPAWFAAECARPEPGGRALMALLACAAEKLSARRFGEYLSLAQLPQAPPGATPALSPPPAEGFPERAFDQAFGGAETANHGAAPIHEPDAGSRAPWRWEKLLVEAAVIGGRERWERRLEGLDAELRLKRAAHEAEDGAAAAALAREIDDLAHLRRVALPIIGALDELPGEAPWAQWLDRLGALAALAIRDAGETLRALGELRPLGPVGPVTLAEVRAVLGRRLGRTEPPRPTRRAGAVFVGTPETLRGMAFDVVIAPGLAERGFPRKLAEDPLLRDAQRRRLDPSLATQDERIARERLALRLAAGAARRRLALTYPRVDLEHGRPRVPSFYALEVLRAAEGRLPGFDELARRAAGDRPPQLGWPAPARPADAIDEAEFDLALLERLAGADPETTAGAAHYLLEANPHLGRALRARARRWRRLWTRNDGMVEPELGAGAALAAHRLDARSYSATALQHYAACPYRFFLYAIQRLEPREEAEPIDAIDPLTRGALFHEVQYETLTALRADRALPVTAPTLERAQAALETHLERVAAEYRERLWPAIERVWQDGIDSIRADLREWLRRMAEEPARWRPERFELAFGLKDRAHADPASVAEPIDLGVGLKLRGSIDLIERGPDGEVRVTDYKTGRVRAARDLLIGGGRVLQPALYALAAERILGEPVGAGRLYYCTAAGGYEERVVAMDQAARGAAAEFAGIVGRAIEAGFMPAAPDRGECDYCDYRRVCGPYEEERVRFKTGGGAEEAARLASLGRQPSAAARRLGELWTLRAKR